MTGAAITVVGSNMVDLMSYLDRFPQPGETVRGRAFARGFGGKGANQAVMAALLGARVRMVTCLGDDDHAAAWMAHFAAHGIDASGVATADGVHCGVASVWIAPDGENRIVLGMGANDRLSAGHVARAVAGRPADVVLAQLEVPQAAIAAGFAAGRAQGAVTILNPGPAAALDADLVRLTDWLLPNETELRFVADALGVPARDDDVALAAALAGRLGIDVVVTLGSRGAAWARPGAAPVTVAAPAVAAVDTTGAGDAFAGGFAHALGAGLAVVDAVRLAVAVSADSVTRPGTAASFSRGAALQALVRGVLADPALT